MKRRIDSIKAKTKAVLFKMKAFLTDTRGESYIDTGIKILLAVVLGALLLAGLYALFGNTILPTLTQRIQDMFNYTN